MSKRKNANAGASVRSTREAEQSINVAVHDDDDTPWARGSSLEMPPARAGMDQRWIVFAINGRDYPTNISRKLREGWKVREAATCPASWQPMKADQGRFAGAVVVEGSVLCERPLSVSARRTKHFADLNAKRTDAVNADLKAVNRQNKNPAFGDIQMAVESKRVREKPVVVQDD